MSEAGPTENHICRLPTQGPLLALNPTHFCAVPCYFRVFMTTNHRHSTAQNLYVGERDMSELFLISSMTHTALLA